MAAQVKAPRMPASAQAPTGLWSPVATSKVQEPLGCAPGQDQRSGQKRSWWGQDRGPHQAFCRESRLGIGHLYARRGSHRQHWTGHGHHLELPSWKETLTPLSLLLPGLAVPCASNAKFLGLPRGNLTCVQKIVTINQFRGSIGLALVSVV